MSRISTEAEQDQVATWLTPTADEVLVTRSAIVAALAQGAMGEPALRTACDIDDPGALEVTIPQDTRLVGGVLSEDHLHVKGHRANFGFLEALRQLKQDNIVQTCKEPPPFKVSGRQLTRGGSSGFNREQFAPKIELGWQLTSLARGWTAADHEAFDAALFAFGPRGRLVTPDGHELLEEAIESYRFDRQLSAVIVLGTFAETAWFEAARIIEPADSGVSQELQKSMPAISRVQDAVVSFFKSSSGANGRSRFLATNLDTWANSTRTVRNFGAHGNVTAAMTGSFTAAATAVRIMDAYRHLEELEQALQVFSL